MEYTFSQNTTNSPYFDNQKKNVNYKQDNVNYKQVNENYKQNNENYKQDNENYKQNKENYKQNNENYKQDNINYKQDKVNVKKEDLNVIQVKEKLIENSMNSLPIENISHDQTHNTNSNKESNNINNAPSAGDNSALYLVNELSKYNKITHQYTLIDEKGPDHKKVFTVSLKIGEEEFISTGVSIRKAQHAAAEEALTQTSYTKPVKKSKKNLNKRIHSDKSNPSLTPTVELNTLAMKLGKNVTYKILNIPYRHPNFFYRQNVHQNFYYQPYLDKSYDSSYSMSRVEMEVEVDGKVFRGCGTWKKQAKNSCAAAALKHLKLAVERTASACDGDDDSVAMMNNENEKTKTNISEICQIYNIAMERHLTVTFTVTKESGPAHMKVYQTTCVCGDIQMDGVGNSKKDSKKKSAENMLEALNLLPPLSPSSTKTQKSSKKSKTSANKTKLQVANPDLREGFHPISRLFLIQQAKKQALPVFQTLKESGTVRNKKYLVEVAVGDQTCSAWSSKIKTARVLATQSMLQLLGYVKPSTNAFKDDPSVADNGMEKKLSLIDRNIESLAAELVDACGVDQLMYIGQKLGFLVNFRDFPKNTQDGNFVTLVSLTTIPILHCHGEGPSLEESQNNAASNSIQQLSEFVAHMKVSLLPPIPTENTSFEGKEERE